MSGGQEEEAAEKSFEATPHKLQRAREKGDIAKSTDLSVAAAYAGLLLAAMAVGADSLTAFGEGLLVLLDQPERLAPLVFDGQASAPMGGLMQKLGHALMPWFLVPAVAVVLSLIAQRGFVFAPSKLEPKMSRISIIQNAKNKFGRNGLFEWAKSFTKLILYSICLGLFLKARLVEIISTVQVGATGSILLMVRMFVEFMFLAVLIAAGIGAIDAVWQHAEHLRKNRMTRKEVTDENKESDGDPYMKQERRYRAQEIAHSQMMADVPEADVVIVNPTHYAVALQWSRLPGSAPVCVAKGVDELAATIRRIANENGVPIHHDPPTARALHAATRIGDQIDPDHYVPVAAAIRFAEEMRRRAKGRVT